MRDLYERGGFVSPIHRAAVMKAHDDLVAGPEKPVGGQNGIGRSTVRAGAAEGAGRASEEMWPSGETMRHIQSLLIRPLSAKDVADLKAKFERPSGLVTFLPRDPWSDVIHEIEEVYAAAQRAMAAAGPMPLTSSEPWVEGDEAYRERLNRVAVKAPFCTDAYCDELQLRSDYRLDSAGVVLGLPRARLAPTTSRAEEPHP